MGSKLYVMISHTDTEVGQIIRFVSGFPYNHVAVTLDDTFRNWVSFARYVQDTPFYGGFIQEPVERYLAKGQQIDVQIFALDISDEMRAALEQIFALAGTRDARLCYNLFALATLAVGIDIPITGAYTCLGFANTLLGTDFRSIKALSKTLAPYLHYEGCLSALAPDSGSREDAYFTRLGFFRGFQESLKSIGSLIRFACDPNRPDPIRQVLPKEGVLL